MQYMTRTILYEMVVKFCTWSPVDACCVYNHSSVLGHQVMRVVRLIKASPMLEDFCWKVGLNWDEPGLGRGGEEGLGRGGSGSEIDHTRQG